MCFFMSKSFYENLNLQSSSAEIYTKIALSATIIRSLSMCLRRVWNVLFNVQKLTLLEHSLLHNIESAEFSKFFKKCLISNNYIALNHMLDRWPKMSGPIRVILNKHLLIFDHKLVFTLNHVNRQNTQGKIN